MHVSAGIAQSIAVTWRFTTRWVKTKRPGGRLGARLRDAAQRERDSYRNVEFAYSAVEIACARESAECPSPKAQARLSESKSRSVPVAVVSNNSRAFDVRTDVSSLPLVELGPSQDSAKKESGYPRWW